METAIILSTLKAMQKGANLSATYGKTLKTRKTYNGKPITKKTKIVLRSGIEYDNQKAVQEGRENGDLPSENAGLPWGQWSEFPYLIEHKGEKYVRFYPASGLEFRPKTQYFLGDTEVDKDSIKDFCLASEFSKPGDEEPLCYTIKASNVISIG